MYNYTQQAKLLSASSLPGFQLRKDFLAAASLHITQPSIILFRPEAADRRFEIWLKAQIEKLIEKLCKLNDLEIRLKLDFVTEMKSRCKEIEMICKYLLYILL